MTLQGGTPNAGADVRGSEENEMVRQPLNDPTITQSQNEGTEGAFQSIRENFPVELLEQRRWAVSLKGGKRPFMPAPQNGFNPNNCSPTNPDTWSSFEECASSLNPAVEHVGFFMDAADDIVVIDVDDPSHPIAQQLIAGTNHSYAEYSVSGNPDYPKMHILVRGHLPAAIKTAAIEVYSHSRYMVCTGKTVAGSHREITDQQPLLNWLWDKLGDKESLKTETANIRVQELTEEQKTYWTPRVEANALWMGETNTPRFRHGPKLPHEKGPDKSGCWNSEAESTLCMWLLHETDYDPQLTFSLMMASPMIQEMATYSWHRGRNLQRRILNNTIPSGLPKARAQKAINEDMAQTGAAIAARIMANHKTEQAEIAKSVKTAQKRSNTATKATTCPEHILHPGGMVEQLTDCIERNSAHSHRLFSLGSALTFFSAVALMNVCTETGIHPNLFTIIAGRSGIGKDSTLRVLPRVFRSNLDESDARLPRLVGATSVASGQGVLDYMQSNPKFVLALDEFGEFIKEAKNPGSPRGSFMALLLEMFQMPGEPYKRLYRDNAKNGIYIPWQAFSFIGASTIAGLWSALESDDANKGFLSRFLIFEMDMPKRKARKTPPTLWIPEGLVNKLEQISRLGDRSILCGQQSVDLRPEPCPIPSSPEAEILWDELETKYIDLENSTEDDAIKTIYARVPLHVSKLALLHALSLHGPIIVSHGKRIEVESMQWAIDLAEFLTTSTVKRMKNSLHSGVHDSLQKRVLRCIAKHTTETSPGVSSAAMFGRYVKNVPAGQRKPILRELENEGLVVSEKIKPKSGPSKTVFKITDEGLDLID